MSNSLVGYISRKLYKNEILNDEHLFVFELVPQNMEDLLDCPTGFWILSII